VFVLLFSATFQFEDHEAVFPITIKQPQPPVLYDMGKGGSSLSVGITHSFIHGRKELLLFFVE